MRLEWLKRPFNSVFTKLITVMLFSGSLLVIGTVSGKIREIFSVTIWRNTVLILSGI